MISNSSLIKIFKIIYYLNNGEELYYGSYQDLKLEKDVYDEIKSKIPLCNKLEKICSKKFLNYLENERYKNVNKNKEDK
jgi:hypothetical protein